ncbi:MAG TPA: SdpA family antimicrobial peptide system protein [Hyalangium sp.]|nr:SdpA family antimicrobial peptide system protein [Hyalangium sp.]
MTANTSPPDALRARRLGLLALGLITGWSIVAAYALHSALPYNPIKLPFEDRVDVKLVLPEGWAFFTRDPRDERMMPFQRGEHGGWVAANKTPNFQPQNSFGIDRAARAQGVELGLLLDGVRGEERLSCEEDPLVCLERAPVAQARNTSPRPSLCGQVGLVFQKAVPWAWARSSKDKKIIMPSKVMRMDIQC